jgi:membrane protein DedA with SNARE-associated domain
VPACVIWSLAYVSLGAATAGGYRELSSRLHGAGYLFVAVIVVFIALVVIGKKLLEKREARHMDHPGDGDANTIED